MTPQSTGLSFHTHNRVMGSSLPSDRNTKSVGIISTLQLDLFVWDKGNARAGWSDGQERVRGRSDPREFRMNMRTCVPYSRRDTFTPLTETPKEILAMESVSFLPPPPLIGTLEKQNMNKFRDYHGDRGHNTNDCYHLKRQIEEVVSSGKLAQLVKGIRRSN
ncbi:hypothetical protein Tco_0317215 [Tanacetum coccineum]